jgi:uncharacterized protein (TIGR02391 family)
MAIGFARTIPDPAAIQSLQPEELAAILLRHLQSLSPRDGSLNRHNFFHDPNQSFDDYPPDSREAVADAFLAAWVWLEREGLLLPRVGAGAPDWVKVSARGQRLVASGDFAAYRHATLLPRGLVHPSIVDSVWASFLRGHYDTAVFEAFREVEVAIRTACGYSNEEYGLELVKRAFNKDKGPLRDPKAAVAERIAVGQLFEGALGLFKNATSHRRGTVNDPKETVELILFASHLLRIVDERKP